jgi:hypothetical protein
MSDYWKGLMDWNCEGYQANKKREKMVEYDTPMHGQQNIAEVREQIQEDVITFIESCQTIARYNEQFIKDNLCQIVVDNFKKLEK